MLQFSKYQGLGNDFVIFEGRHNQLPSEIINPEPAWIRRICDRRFGVGGDGIILALPPQTDGDLRMRIFNADGTEAEMCGNGIRCLACYLADTNRSIAGCRWVIESLAGMIQSELMPDGRFRVDMGAPLLQPNLIPTTLKFENGLPRGVLKIGGLPVNVVSVGMGNPHAIVPVDDLDTVPFEEWGSVLEAHPVFPDKTNVHFLKVRARNRLEIRVWERGIGPTLACGTGACATLVAAVLLDLADEQAEVILPGGSLQISWPDQSGPVLMTGPAQALFNGVLKLESVPGDETVALEQAQAFLNNTSLESMLKLASNSFEQRTRSRLKRGGS
ncbi:diaminopimelate epimerase [Synechococcus sp. M16CYN]|uniref:diaminopimelate epimerase n=1 Tax=Synechococcus sp. M16CYN TaxID=3103139 RepID=UPI0030E02663